MKAFAFAALLIGFGAFTLVGTLASSVPAAAKGISKRQWLLHAVLGAGQRQKTTAKQ
jgi:hypothetical protein